MTRLSIFVLLFAGGAAGAQDMPLHEILKPGETWQPHAGGMPAVDKPSQLPKRGLPVKEATCAVVGLGGSTLFVADATDRYVWACRIEKDGTITFEFSIEKNSELAKNLKGHLMLVTGDIDNNVHPANTMRLVDALIKANKRFDMLILPGKRHAFADYQPYFQQRMWDFFAEHLLGDRQTKADIYDKDVKRR